MTEEVMALYCYIYFMIGLFMGGVTPIMGTPMEKVDNKAFKVFWLILIASFMTLLFWFSNAFCMK